MIPEPGALPLRGGFVTEGDFLATPLVVEDVVSERFTLHVKKDLDALHLVVLDLESGELSVVDHGNAKAGDEILVPSESSLCTVFAGGVVDGRPFEGYSSFIRPSQLALGIDVFEKIRPGQDLVVKLSLQGASGTTPVLLAVRDQRLTATDRPSVSLGASAKKNITDATEGMDEGFFDSDRVLPWWLWERDVVCTEPAPPAASPPKSHAMGQIAPHPMPTDFTDDPRAIAEYSFQMYGRKGLFASYEDTLSITS